MFSSLANIHQAQHATVCKTSTSMDSQFMKSCVATSLCQRQPSEKRLSENERSDTFLLKFA